VNKKRADPSGGPASGTPEGIAIEPTWDPGVERTDPGSNPSADAPFRQPPPARAASHGRVPNEPAEVPPARAPALPLPSLPPPPPAAMHVGDDRPNPLSGLAGALLDSMLAAAPSSPSPAEHSGDYPVTSWERYEFLGLLGRGGMGSVYKARDRRIDRIVALKFIAGAGERLKQRFLQEARMQSRLDHPGICKIYEVGEVKGQPYIAMEFIEGQSLQRAQPQLGLLDKIQLIQQTAEALHTAHERGIIHRDIKPANIMVARRADGGLRPVLTDFGLARDVNAAAGLTDSGAVLGTPWYMSPEQTRGEIRTMDRRTDIYSLGATLYELVGGRPPFHSQTTVDALVDIMSREAPSLSGVVSNLPPGLDIVVAKCLNKEPVDRYATALELAADLARLLDNQKVAAKRLGLWHRLRFRARHNRPATAAILALLLSLLTLGSYGLHSHMGTLRAERRQREMTELASRLGQRLGQLESRALLAYAMPLHDVRHELGQIQEQLHELEQELRVHGELSGPLTHYVLGRGHLALHEWQPALRQLKQAESDGLENGELDYALGRALGALYTQELTQARRSGDESFLLRRQAELDREYLQPALGYLRRSRSRGTLSGSYAAGLIDFYEGHLDAALLQAQLARRQLTWSYEPLKLIGEIHQARALHYKTRGEYTAAASSFEAALRAFGQASELGRSDYQLHEAIAEVAIRQMELAGLQSENPKAHLPVVLLAADHALEADPIAASGHAKRAFAYLFIAQYLESQGISEGRENTLSALITSGEAAVTAHPSDEYAHDVLGTGYVMRAKYASQQLQQFDRDLARARQHFQLALSLNPRFPWAYNDLGGSYLVQGDDLQSRFLDPSDAYQHAIAAYSEAVRIDPTYQFAYANIALAYSNLARFATESGQDPEIYTKKSIEAAQKGLNIDNNNLSSLTTSSFSTIMSFIYDSESNDPPSDSLKTDAHERARRLGVAFPHLPHAFQHQAAIDYYLARQQARSGKSPVAAMEQAEAALGECQRLQGDKDATCAGLQALLSVLQAEQARGGAAQEAAEQQALSRARLALELAAGDNDVLQAVAETWLRVARLRLRRQSRVLPELEAGMAALRPVLSRAPTWPRAQITQAGLAALRARTARDESERTRFTRAARTALATATAGNPNLRRSYREFVADVEALAAPAAGSR